MHTTTYGVGELIRDAIQKGCRHFIVGIGGSVTNDGGVGMLQALGYGMLDNDGNQIRTYRVSVRRLCMILTLTAKKYYEENKEKFTFLNYSIMDWDYEMEKMKRLTQMEG